MNKHLQNSNHVRMQYENIWRPLETFKVFLLFQKFLVKKQKKHKYLSVSLLHTWTPWNNSFSSITCTLFYTTL